MSTVQFYMSRLIAETLPIHGIAAEARGVGLIDATLQYSNTRWRPGETLVTCQMPVAQFLVDRLRRLAGEARRNGEDGLILAADSAVEVCEAAMAHPYSPEGGPANGMRQQPN